MSREPLIPQIAEIVSVRTDTPDIKTFTLTLPGGGKPFSHRPGQCAMLSLPGAGEGMFSITSSPTREDAMEFSIKRCGVLTDALHALEPGSQITIRGPYGRPFPVDDVFAGQNLLFVAGGVGLAPLRSVIDYCRAFRDRYGRIDIVYGARSKDDLLDYGEIASEWSVDRDVHVHLTIDREQEGWSGHVGFVPGYVKELAFDPNRIAILCGPPIMIKFTLSGLLELGFSKDRMYTTLEMRMKCGIGKCGRCNIGSKYVCKDGPVFCFDELDELPDEY